jgi:hypothetical protein
MRLSHGTRCYIRLYINAVAGSVMLYLQHDVCTNVQNQIIYSLRVSPLPPPPQGNVLGARLTMCLNTQSVSSVKGHRNY